MKIINFGSLNIDHVYSVKSFVKPGETISSLDYNQFCGGKGCNQSIALAKAGASVMHVGIIGADGKNIENLLNNSGADTTLITCGDRPTGHAVIQVDKNGENSIIIHGGANKSFDPIFIEEAFKKSEPGDIILTQNETNCVPEILTQAKAKGLYVVFNPSPMTHEVLNYPLSNVNLFIVNETEGKALTEKSEPDDILSVLLEKLPESDVVLTLGAKGVMYRSSLEKCMVPALNVKAVDTTAAGDTFIGYLLACLSEGIDIIHALKTACKASAICVQKPGAAASIPFRHELS